MNHEGFRGLTNFGSLEHVREALNDENPDLLVLGVELKGETVCSTINELRHNEMGRNPFVPVIVTTWNAKRIFSSNRHLPQSSATVSPRPSDGRTWLKVYANRRHMASGRGRGCRRN